MSEKKPAGKTTIKLGMTFNQTANADLEIKTFRKTRWQRFLNIILLPWRYVWHGRFKL